jgi:hypothetical protein
LTVEGGTPMLRLSVVHMEIKGLAAYGMDDLAVDVESINTLRWTPRDGRGGSPHVLQVTSDCSCAVRLPSLSSLTTLPIPMLPGVLESAVRLMIQSAIETVRSQRLVPTPAVTAYTRCCQLAFLWIV